MTVTERASGLDHRSLRLVRIFDAPRERVFAAWTVAERFMQWMCPPEAGLDRCELDVRAGGLWRATGYGHGRRFATSGVYLEVKPRPRNHRAYRVARARRQDRADLDP
jgi:uncharacterized protein YndB with AHSA1/START domain